jgi:hypothetical protein
MMFKIFFGGELPHEPPESEIRNTLYHSMLGRISVFHRLTVRFNGSKREPCLWWDSHPAGIDIAKMRIAVKWTWRLDTFARPLCLLLLLALAGCRTVLPPLPEANLKQPGWKAREGQAIWRLAHRKEELAGEVLVATRSDGRAFVQFSKNPFPFVIAQATANSWEVTFPAQNKHYAGRGKPPERLIWLYLPRLLSGQPPPANWIWHEDASGWRLENHSSGEALEGFFTQ